MRVTPAGNTSRRGRGEGGIVAANLAITLAFALFAVVQLTRTVVAVQDIDDRVEVIVGEVGPIDENLTNVAQLDETDRMAKEILVAAEPLSGQADQIITAAQSIDQTVVKIQDNATSINGTVKDIRGNFTALAPVVRSINDGVAAINGRVDRIIELVAGIKGDLSNVLIHVGGPGPDGHVRQNYGKTIHGHANSIDCSRAVEGQACGE